MIVAIMFLMNIYTLERVEVYHYFEMKDCQIRANEFNNRNTDLSTVIFTCEKK